MMKNKSYAAERRNTFIGNLIFDAIIAITLAFVVIVTVYPFWNTIAISFNDWILLRVELNSGQENLH